MVEVHLKGDNAGNPVCGSRFVLSVSVFPDEVTCLVCLRTAVVKMNTALERLHKKAFAGSDEAFAAAIRENVDGRAD